jgi:hypothetical protein
MIFWLAVTILEIKDIYQSTNYLVTTIANSLHLIIMFLRQFQN